MPRSHDGRERFQLTKEIRDLIKAEPRNKEKESVKEAFARHTNWAKVASELRINRPQAAPVFSIDGRSTTSDEEAITAIVQHIEKIYSSPSHPISIPPWNQEHGVKALGLHEAIWRLSPQKRKEGKASDTSGLSNACIKSLREGTLGCISDLIKTTAKTGVDFRANGTCHKDSSCTKKETGINFQTTGC